MFPPSTKWKPPKMCDLPSWNGARRVCVDLETRDPQLTTLGPGVRRGGYVVGIAFAIEDGPAHYLPIAHEAGGNLDADKVWTYLQNQSAGFRGDVVGANLGYDLDYLWENDVMFNGCRFFRDVQIAEPLLDENQFLYGLDAIAPRYGFEGKKDGLLRAAANAHGLDPKAEMWRLHSKFVGDYAEGDVTLPLQILRKQERLIEEQAAEDDQFPRNLWDIYNLESRVLPVLVRMRRRGIRIDFDALDRFETWARDEIEAALRVVKHSTGYGLEPGDLNTAEAIAKALEPVGIVLPLTAKSKAPCTAAGVLEAFNHDAARAIVRARKFDKMIGTFVGGVRRHATNGRLHCILNQLRRTKEDGKPGGTVTGRLSGSNPNLQNQPNPKKNPEISGPWRRIFLPEEGEEWCSADYSAQEPRLIVHFAVLKKCRGAAKAALEYRKGDIDPHQITADMVGIDRASAKIIFLGLCYGEGEAKLCHDLGFDTKWVECSWTEDGKREVAGPEGEKFLSNFHRFVPFVSELSKACKTQAASKGYLVTLGGRRCRFPWDKVKRCHQWTRKALNRIAQSSAADQTKMAMVEADRANLPLNLQMHDELCMSTPNREQAETLAEIMREVVQLEVPSKVDLELGPNWGEAK